MKFTRQIRRLGWLLLLVLPLIPSTLPAAEKRTAGRDIYRQQCAKSTDGPFSGFSERRS